MDTKDKNSLLGNRPQLVRDLIVNEELLSVLVQKGVITSEMKETIESKPTSQKKAGCLLDILPRRGKSAFKVFIKALNESEQRHLACLLSGNSMVTSSEVDSTDTADDWMQNMDEVIKNINEKPIMTVKVKQMSEILKSELKKSDDVYPLNHGGLAVVINNQFFERLSEREGSSFDLKNFSNLFEQLHFEMHVERNLTVEEIKSKIEFAKQKLKSGRYDVFVFCIMSHGAKGVVCGKNGKKLNIYSDILTCFNDRNCPEMAGKPKLFFIQACQDESPPPQNVTDNGSQLLIDSSSVIWNSPDIFLAFGTVEGSKAWRHAELGSWFIRSLVYVFSNRACKDHLDQLLTQVCSIISHFKVDGKTPQLTERRDTLSKKFYFLC